MDTLRLTKPMMHGSAVRRLQELTDMLGIDLGPNDGIYGENTEAEVMAFQRHNGLTMDGICGPATWRAILADVDAKGATVGCDGAVIDRRGRHALPKLWGRPRLPSSVFGVTIHQTGCNMPRKAEGWDRLNAHIGITQEGAVIIENDPGNMIWHAQGLSLRTIGIEFEGNFCGLDGDLRTLWKGGGGPHHVPSAMRIAIDVVFDWLSDWFKTASAEWKFTCGHRQSKDTRIADPGEELWKLVAIPWMEANGSTDGGATFKMGSGRPIPREWAGQERPTYYERV